MSSKTLDASLEFVPSTGGQPRSLLATMNTFWHAVVTGVAASYSYDTLRARGIPADKAVTEVFKKHFA